MQRVSSWLFPFSSSSSDDVASEKADNGYVYKYSSSKQAPGNKLVCNPCNKVPWIPMFHTYSSVPSIPALPSVPVNDSTDTQSNVVINVHSNHLPENTTPRPAYRPPTYHPIKYTFSPPYGNKGVTSPEYLPPSQQLPIQNENRPYAPIPLPNLSKTPIPPLYDAKSFYYNPYKRELPHLQLVPHLVKPVLLEPVPQLSNTVNVQHVIPVWENQHVDTTESSIEVIQSIPIAHFSSQEIITTNSNNHLSIENHQGLHTNVHHVAPDEHTVEHNVASSYNIGQQNTFQALNQKQIPLKVSTNNDNNNFGQLNTQVVTNNEQSGSNDATIIYGQQKVEQPMQPIVVDNYADPSIKQTLALNHRPDEDISEQLYNALENNEITTMQNLLGPDPIVQTGRPYSGESDRLTPKFLLDTPISHYNKFSTESPQTTVVVREDFANFTQPAVESGSWEPSAWTTVLPVEPVVIARTTPRSIDFNDSNTGGVKPNKNPISTKRPKQIQIIIPYTTYHKPAPFKATEEEKRVEIHKTGKFITFDRLSGWTNNTQNDQEFPQESKQITSTVIPDPPITENGKYLTKILASNIRDLLKKERTVTEVKPKPNLNEKSSTKPSAKPNKTSKPKVPFDLFRFQKNIDGWTEQEFSVSDFNLKASTISLIAPSKKIPDEYLTTTPIPAIHREQKMHKPSENAHGFELADEEVQKNEVREEKPKRYEPPSTNELWKKLKVSISPITKEKVYVVTPQPWHTFNGINYASQPTFTSPRFSVRPTPAATKGKCSD